jgi:hypothetical protein
MDVVRHRELNSAPVTSYPRSVERISVWVSTPVLNRFGLDCLSCHAQAAPQWDMVCDRDHGCDPIPLTDEIILALQQSDPRPT